MRRLPCKCAILCGFPVRSLPAVPTRVFVRSKNRTLSRALCLAREPLGTCGFRDDVGLGTQRDYGGSMAYPAVGGPSWGRF
jgi:hypothetical protein